MLAHVDMYFCRTGLSCQWDKTLVLLLTLASGSLLNTGTSKTLPMGLNIGYYLRLPVGVC
ncbi:hypothetical protein SLEP1_g28807 [Rubroshorea leprosula]|uniref:Uncharacterized protein n=1 Tax=Rubroshorea leprosula TaxID=152421 RepID=A0AAV5K475_9ROSI|nr:hypothetical protein SLEP1_g28807 [Rubroshorea leprosula]